MPPLQELNLPPYDARVVDTPRGQRIYDRLRRRYVTLTPEEWVRQHFVEYLINHKDYPAGLMANEMGIKLNDTLKRCDTVVMDHYGQPLVIVEYKAPSIVITQQVFDQIVRYNMVLQARYLMVSNGMRHYCCEVDYINHKVSFLTDIPHYSDLIQ